MPYAKRRGANKRKLYKPYKNTTRKGGKNDNKSFKPGQAYHVKPEPFPRILYTRAKFTDDIQLTCNTFSCTAVTYRLNSIWDPRFASSGTTVAGYSILSSVYDNYQVLGAKVQISFANPTRDGLRVGYRLRINGDNPVSTGTLQAVSNQPLTYLSGLNNTGSQKKNFNIFVKPWTLLGVSKLQYMMTPDVYGNSMGGNPAGNAWMDIFAVNPWDNTSQTVDILVKIIYYVKLFNRKALLPS